jgi:hypothetical protein
MASRSTTVAVIIGLGLAMGWVLTGGPVRDGTRWISRRIRWSPRAPATRTFGAPHGDVPYHPGGAL